MKIGQRVFNHGDMCNQSHFGTITDIKAGQVEFTPDAGGERDEPYWIPITSFDAEYKGHAGTRFVTEEAYNKFFGKG